MNSRRVIAGAALLLLSFGAAFGQADLKTGKGAQDAARAGRFRVTLTGFTVDRQTADNVLETDGKGDEVYILADVAQYDSYHYRFTSPRYEGNPYVSFVMGDMLNGRGNLTSRRSLASVLMGYDNYQDGPPRIRAGSAGDLGGLRTGDRFPTNEPWLMNGNPSESRLPMLLWEGDLRKDQDLVIIIPTVWEWDGGNPPLRARFAEYVDGYFRDRTYHNLPFPLLDFIGGDAFGAGDRPVGMKAGHPWDVHGLTVNFDNAQWAAGASPARLGTGVLSMTYHRPGEESYTLYFKVERLK